jgi:EAL domain-containing protein (putative c-di-GMP-specific phosphodiesterase class I)
MGITSNAEGVETQAQLEFLRGRGCDEMQGFIVSPPLRAEAVAAYLAKHRDGPGAFPLSGPRSA